MGYYWFIFFLPVMGVITPARFTGTARYLVWCGLGVVTILFLGLRFEVGGDWVTYLEHYYRVESDGLSGLLILDSLGHGLFNWLGVQVNGGIYAVNTIYAIVFVGALITFCLRQPLPWLAWLIATPYLIFVVAIGYTRQSAALAFLLFALGCLEERQYWRFIVLLLVGSIFHPSVGLLAPLVFLAEPYKVIHRIRSLVYRETWNNNAVIARVAVAIILTSVLLYAMISYLTPMVEYYVERGQWESSGGKIRIIMNATPGVVLLVTHKVWKKNVSDPGFWKWLALGAIVSLLLVTTFSTAVDRVGLYLLPLQIYVWSRFPLLFSDRIVRGSVVLGIILLYGCVLWVWLNFAEHAYLWIPYKNILLH